jgi:hypothetical protein
VDSKIKPSVLGPLENVNTLSKDIKSISKNVNSISKATSQQSGLMLSLLRFLKSNTGKVVTKKEERQLGSDDFTPILEAFDKSIQQNEKGLKQNTKDIKQTSIQTIESVRSEIDARSTADKVERGKQAKFAESERIKQATHDEKERTKKAVSDFKERHRQENYRRSERSARAAEAAKRNHARQATKAVNLDDKEHVKGPLGKSGVWRPKHPKTEDKGLTIGAKSRRESVIDEKESRKANRQERARERLKARKARHAKHNRSRWLGGDGGIDRDDVDANDFGSNSDFDTDSHGRTPEEQRKHERREKAKERLKERKARHARRARNATRRANSRTRLGRMKNVLSRGGQKVGGLASRYIVKGW